MSCGTCPDVFELCVNEGSTVKYTAYLKDNANVLVPLVSLTSLVLTLKNVSDGSVVNSRTAQDVKNVNDGTYHATSGLFTMQFQTDDAVIVNESARIDKHIATFKAVVSGGDELQWDVILKVKNLGKTT